MVTSTVSIVLPADPTEELEATTKQYVDTGLATKAGVPYFGAVPAGSVTPTITHNLGTADVDVTVYRSADGLQVGVPADRLDADSVQLTFSTAPTSGQYRVVVSAGTGAGSGGEGGGGGAPDPHAASHAVAGSDPVSPSSIGAAGVAHAHDGLVPIAGDTGYVLTKNSGSDYDYGWAEGGGGGGAGGVKPFPPIDLADTQPVNTNAALSTHFRLTMEGNRTLAAPTNPTNGQLVLWEVKALSSIRTLTLATGSAGTFVFGTDIVAVSSIGANLTDYIQAIYDERAASGTGRWRVISYIKGFPA